MVQQRDGEAGVSGLLPGDAARGASYAAFRTWLVGKVVEGAEPRLLSKWLSTYRSRHLEGAPNSWCDGLPEVPSEAEVASFERDAW